MLNTLSSIRGLSPGKENAVVDEKSKTKPKNQVNRYGNIITYSKPKMLLKNKQISYESPVRVKKAVTSKIITLEENYSQSKNYQKGTIHSITNISKVNDCLKPTPAKSSVGGSHQKSCMKAKVVTYDPNPLQTNNKPTSVKVEQ